MWDQLASSLKAGDQYVIAILILFFVTLVLLFERLIMLQFVYHVDFRKFLNSLKKMLAAEDIGRAISYCKSISKTSIPYIALRSLEAAEVDPTTVKGTLEEETLDFLPRLETRITIFPAIAAIAMLIGVLGTIDGIWKALQAIEVLDTQKKQIALTHGIASSLSPAALGVLVCILTLIGHHIVKSMAIQLTERVHQATAVLYNLLVPAEVMAVASAAAPVEAAPAGSFDAGEPPPPVAVAEGPAQSETVEPAAVEDIKDEEEII
jgi:biopolymer transport protein ExbB